MSDSLSTPLAGILVAVADDLAAWAQALGGRLTLAESPRAALDVLTAGTPGGFSAAMFFESDQSQAEHPRDAQCRGQLTVAIMRNPGLTVDRMASHIRDGQRPALWTIIDSLRAHVAAVEFEQLPSGILEYQSCRYLQLQDGALANGYALTWAFTYFHNLTTT